MPGIKRWLRCRVLVGGLALVLALLCALPLVYPPSRQWPAQVLVESTVGSDKADAILLLMGDIGDRTPHAAELWKRGVAPKIVIVTDELNPIQALGLLPPDAEVTYRYLLLLGVPDEAIIFDRSTAVSSTFEEAEALFAEVATKLPEAQHLIICTSWYHSSRAAWIFRRLKPPAFQLSSSPSPAPAQWYAGERNFLFVFTEYLKWAYYLTHY